MENRVTDTISLERLRPNTIPLYCQIGEQSYREHYLHLWKNENPESYLNDSFVPNTVKRELDDHNCAHYIVLYQKRPAGVFKLILHKAVGHYGESEALLLQKIYLKQRMTGLGVGKVCLDFVCQLAQEMGKKVVWLDTMKKSRALPFYQGYGFHIVGETQLPYQHIRKGEREQYILVKEIPLTNPSAPPSS
ncbi:MAG: GNAT family N-acetyltransferase [Flavobacteriaceae bacterium]